MNNEHIVRPSFQVGVGGLIKPINATTVQSWSQSRQLASLSAATILQIENAGFRAKALAMPRVQVADDGIDDFVAHNGRDINVLEHVRASHHDALMDEAYMVVMDDHVVAGFLSRDDDVENPMEAYEGEGHIFHYGHRRGSVDEHQAFMRAMARSGQAGDIDCELPAVFEAVGNLLITRLLADRSLLSRVLWARQGTARQTDWKVLVRRACEIASHHSASPQAFECAFARAFTGDRFYFMWKLSEDDQQRLMPLVELATSLLEDAWESAWEGGRIGDPMALLVDIYEHGGVAYSLSGEGHQCPWDTSRGGAVWVPDRSARYNIWSDVLAKLGMKDSKVVSSLINEDDDHGCFSRAQAFEIAKAQLAQISESDFMRHLYEVTKRYARTCIEIYQQWRNGECFALHVISFDRSTGDILEAEDIDATSIIGSAAAHDELTGEVLAQVVKLGSTVH